MPSIPSEQQPRLLQMQPPFPDKQYSLLISLQGQEGLSQLFQYQLEIITTNDQLTANDVIGKSIDFSLMDLHSAERQVARQFNGIITAFVIGDNTIYYQADQQLNCRRYFLTVAPMLWLLHKGSHNRVFQRNGQTVLDIITHILQPYGITPDSSQVTAPLLWEYCTQYQETDFQFFERILAQAGIYYYFQQQVGKHTLVLANSVQGYLSNSTSLRSVYDTAQNPSVSNFRQQHYLYSKSTAVTNAVIAQGNTSLFNQQVISGAFNLPAAMDAATQLNFPMPLQSNADGKALSQIEVDRALISSQLFIGESDYCQLQAAALINLSGKYFSQLTVTDQVIISLQFSANDNRHPDNNNTEYHYHNKWTAIAKTQCFRPLKIAKPNPGYFQLATIVNSQGKTSTSELINNDKYGRHSIKFIWEDNPTNSTVTNTFDQCRVRVLNNWDNGNYRVGTPVIIGFIDSDIDKPIILGATNDAFNLLQGEYNDDNQFTSVIKRFPGVDDGSNYNQLSFNDKKNAEVLTMFAGKDLNVVVNKGDLTTNIKTGNDTYELAQGNRSIKIDKGNDTYTLSAGNETHHVNQGERQLMIAGNESHKNNANYHHQVMSNYTLEVTGNLTIKAAGDLTISSAGKVSIEGLTVEITGPTGVKIN